MTKSILVIEDERPLVDAIKKKLEINDFTVLQARSVDEAWQHLRNASAKVDAIWLDHYLLGKATGIDFVAKLKEEKAPVRDIPVFVVSNTAGPDKVQSYLRLGINKYFTKAEFRLEDIISDIKKVLNQAE